MRAGVSPQALYAGVREAACKAGRYELAEAVNRRLLQPRHGRDPRSDAIAEAWAAHAQILEALGNRPAVVAHVARATALLAQIGRYDLLPRLAEAKARAQGAAAPVEAGSRRRLAVGGVSPGGAPDPQHLPRPVGEERVPAARPPAPPLPAERPSAPTIDDLPDVLDAKQAAVVLGVKRGTVYEWVKKGKLPHLSYDGSRVTRFRKPDLVAWRDAQAKPARLARTGGARRTLNLRGVRRRRP